MIVIATAQTMLFFVKVGEQLFLPVFHNLLQKRVLVIGLNIEGFSGFKNDGIFNSFLSNSRKYYGICIPKKFIY
jgi:hypothetical protein